MNNKKIQFDVFIYFSFRTEGASKILKEVKQFWYITTFC